MSAPPAPTAAGDPDHARDPGGTAQHAAARATERRRLDLWAPEHPDRDLAVDWLVQSVVDPDGDGADSAYTIGLRRYGIPELQIEARPTFGDDSGADWGLSAREAAYCATLPSRAQQGCFPAAPSAAAIR